MFICLNGSENETKQILYYIEVPMLSYIISKYLLYQSTYVIILFQSIICSFNHILYVIIYYIKVPICHNILYQKYLYVIILYQIT